MPSLARTGHYSEAWLVASLCRARCPMCRTGPNYYSAGGITTRMVEGQTSDPSHMVVGYGSGRRQSAGAAATGSGDDAAGGCNGRSDRSSFSADQAVSSLVPPLRLNVQPYSGRLARRRNKDLFQLCLTTQRCSMRQHHYTPPPVPPSPPDLAVLAVVSATRARASRIPWKARPATGPETSTGARPPGAQRACPCAQAARPISGGHFSGVPAQ